MMNTCDNCTFNGRPAYKSPCSECVDFDKWELNPKTLAELNGLREENCFLRSQLEAMTELHSRAVERANAVRFEKLKVEDRLSLLQGMIGIILTEFRQKTEDSDG